jgi:chlorite dismutase
MKSLTEHEIYAIWNEDATKVLSFHLDEIEALRELDALLENNDEAYHLAAYTLKDSAKHSSEYECGDEED